MFIVQELKKPEINDVRLIIAKVFVIGFGELFVWRHERYMENEEWVERML